MDHAGCIAPTWKRGLDHTDQSGVLSALKGVDHQVGLDDHRLSIRGVHYCVMYPTVFASLYYLVYKHCDYHVKETRPPLPQTT